MRRAAFFASSLAFLLYLGTMDAQATLISRDWQVPGDQALTFDPASGLEWLDVSYTANKSYNDVLNELLAGTFPGFRYAQTDEVVSLFVAAGIPDIGSTSAANAAPVQNLLNLLGLPPRPGGNSLVALTGTTDPSGQYYSMLSWVFPAPPFPTTGTALAAECCITRDKIAQASWLVRTVPEPSVLALLGAGLAGLVYCRRKMKYKEARSKYSDPRLFTPASATREWVISASTHKSWFPYRMSLRIEHPDCLHRLAP